MPPINKHPLNDLRIIFMGTPEFAVASLKKLVEAGCNIVGVITVPDKAGGRGLHLQESAVKKYAVEKGLAVLQPVLLKAPEFLEQLRSFRAHLQIVVAFRMLPELVWNMPPLGTINLHGSILPQYRGAAPINWAIINGEKETGLTTFKLKHEIDTGNILLAEKILIGEDETAGELHDRMKDAGAGLVLNTLQGIANGDLKEIPQDINSAVSKDPLGLKTAPKIFTTTCEINWRKPAQEVYNLIRGLSPYPGAFTYLQNKMIKLFKVSKTGECASTLNAGNYETDHKTYLRFSCTDGYISIHELQLQGKKKMKIEDFLRGFHFDLSETL